MKETEEDINRDIPFIPARENRLFIMIFDLYCRTLFWRRFDEISISNNYTPGENQKTIYYLNHNSWWDGLIPFLLNQRHFRQNARGMMEDTQLSRYSFFSRLGVFSINLRSARSSMQSLRYAIRSMDRPNAALYIYPQGKIVPFSTTDLKFKKGIGWLAKKIPGADLVPVGIYIHTRESDKPRLEIKVGKPVQISRQLSSEKINESLKEELSSLLQNMIEV